MAESITIPAVGDPVVVLYGLPDSMTWDDSGADDAGLEGVLVRILGMGWQDAPFEVRLPDERTLMASRVRVIDDAYRAEKAAERAADDRLALRRLRLLDAALHELGSDPAVPDDVKTRLFQIGLDTANQAWREEQADRPA